MALVINCINWSRHFLDQSSLDELACVSITSFWIMPDHAWIIMPTADKYWQVNGRINFETWSDPSKVWNLQSVWSPCGLEHNHSMLFALQYTNGNFIFLYGKVDWNLWCIKCALLISEIKSALISALFFYWKYFGSKGSSADLLSWIRMYYLVI